MSSFRKLHSVRNKSVRKSRLSFQFFYLTSLPEGRKSASVGDGRLVLCLRELRRAFSTAVGGEGRSAMRENRSRDDHGESIRTRRTGVLATFVSHRTCNFRVVKPLDEIFIPLARSTESNEFSSFRI